MYRGRKRVLTSYSDSQVSSNSLPLLFHLCQEKRNPETFGRSPSERWQQFESCFLNLDQRWSWPKIRFSLHKMVSLLVIVQGLSCLMSGKKRGHTEFVSRKWTSLLCIGCFCIGMFFSNRQVNLLKFPISCHDFIPFHHFCLLNSIHSISNLFFWLLRFY